MKRKSLSAAYFFLGALALLSQTMILREFFVVVYGNEFIFGVLLTNWLIGIFGGAMTGGFVADRNKDNRKTFVISLLVLSVLFPAAITAIRFLYALMGTTLGTYVGFFNVFLSSAIIIIPISFFIGFSFPIASRIHIDDDSPRKRQVQKISTIYIYEALGSLFSGIVYTFFLAGRFPAFAIVALTVLPLCLASFGMIRYSRHRVLRWIALILVAANLVILVPPVNHKIETFTAEKRWSSFSQLPLTYSADSQYQNIIVSQLDGQYNLFLNTMFAAVFPNRDDNMLLAAHLASQHPKPRRILVIGDAVSGLARYLLRFDVEKLIAVEIDPEVVETILKFLPADDKKAILSDKRFSVRIRDGRKYVKDITLGREEGVPPAYFDMVYLNIPEPATLLLNRFYTEEFFQDLSKILKKDGVIAFKVTASASYDLGGELNDYTASVFNTVRTVFPHVVASPGPPHFIFASRTATSISDNPDVLEERYRNSGVTPQRMGMVFKSLYPPFRTEQVKKVLANNKKNLINTDETPIAGFYYNKIIGWYGKSRVAGVFEFFEKIDLKTVIFLVFVLFFARLLYIVVRGNNCSRLRHKAIKFHTLMAVFAAGMAGLSLELVILYIFQNNFGDVYYIIGFIIAVFMFGLPLGAYVSNRLLMKGKFSGDTGIKWFTISIQVSLSVIALLLPRASAFFGKFNILHELMIFLITILVGIAIGLIFPISVHLYLRENEKPGKAAGIINAFDHFGAAVGAFFIGSMLLPVMGVEKVCRLLALLPIVASMLLFTDIFREKMRVRDAVKGLKK